MGGDDVEANDRAVARQAGIINVALLRGDFFTCASQRQRDFWLGSLSALGRVNAYNYAADNLLERLISVVPYGLPSQPPRRQAHGLRGTVPGIGPFDKVVLWGGGVYNWLDPVSVLRAVDRLRHRRTYAWCSSGFATPTRPSRRWRWPRSCRPCRTSSG